MNIAHIVSTFPPYYGGMGNVVLETVKALGARGHEVSVITPLYGRPEESQEQTEATQAVEEHMQYARQMKPTIQYGNAARLPQLKTELRQYDLVHLHYPFFGTANIVRRWKKKNPSIPLVVTYHMDARSPGWKGLIFKTYATWWMPRILRSADALIASSFDYVRLSQAGKIFEQKKHVTHELPFGVDTDRFFPSDRPTSLFLQHNLNNTVPTVVFVGGMDAAHYFKGVRVLLDALLLLKKSGVDCQAVFVGGGGRKESFELRARSYGLHDRVRFVGRVSDDLLPTYYRMGDVTVLPSVNQGEAFGMVLLESFASGVPVIASDLPGVRTVAERAGMVVPPNDAQALAQSMAGFFEQDKEVRDMLRKQARKVAEDEFSWSFVAEKLEEVYDSLKFFGILK